MSNYDPDAPKVVRDIQRARTIGVPPPYERQVLLAVQQAYDAALAEERRHVIEQSPTEPVSTPDERPLTHQPTICCTEHAEQLVAESLIRMADLSTPEQKR